MIAVEANNVGKKYRIRHEVRQGYTALREIMSEKAKQIVRGVVNPGVLFRSRPAVEDFWALKDVSFRVDHGERLGIIGRNGAGKSTLLKILSRITEPTTGSIGINGRITSLLEVGTGFHPELTGRENIFLNGAILGMSRDETRRRFDSIVSFAEIEKFLDTPVKRYSSGMYVRLAFSVAAHLESEILVVDEVLAVGDAAFQKKCLGKMKEISRAEGRTVLFVSHNMGAIRDLCSSCLLLEQGQVVQVGTPHEVVRRYLLNTAELEVNKVADLRKFPRDPGRKAAIVEAWIEDSQGEPIDEVPMGEHVKICMRLESERTLVRPGFGFYIHSNSGENVTLYATYLMSNEPMADIKEGVVVFDFPDFPLLPGQYVLSFGALESPYRVVDSVQMALRFSVTPFDHFGSGNPLQEGHGKFFLNGSVYYKSQRRQIHGA